MRTGRSSALPAREGLSLHGRMTLLVALLAVLALAAGGGAEPKPAKSPFEGDARLDAPVSLEAPLTPLAAALKEIGAQCQVSLAADAGLAGETVMVIVHDQPARRTLEQLA